MCLHCVGCGKCTAEAMGSQSSRNLPSKEELLSEAREYGNHVHEAMEKIFREAREDYALVESACILNLAERFSKQTIDAACKYALEIVPSPRRAFIQNILESGAVR